MSSSSSASPAPELLNARFAVESYSGGHLRGQNGIARMFPPTLADARVCTPHSTRNGSNFDIVLKLSAGSDRVALSHLVVSPKSLSEVTAPLRAGIVWVHSLPAGAPAPAVERYSSHFDDVTLAEWNALSATERSALLAPVPATDAEADAASASAPALNCAPAGMFESAMVGDAAVATLVPGPVVLAPEQDHYVHIKLTARHGQDVNIDLGPFLLFGHTGAAAPAPSSSLAPAPADPAQLVFPAEDSAARAQFEALGAVPRSLAPATVSALHPEMAEQLADTPAVLLISSLSLAAARAVPAADRSPGQTALVAAHDQLQAIARAAAVPAGTLYSADAVAAAPLFAAGAVPASLAPLSTSALRFVLLDPDTPVALARPLLGFFGVVLPAPAPASASSSSSSCAVAPPTQDGVDTPLPGLDGPDRYADPCCVAGTCDGPHGPDHASLAPVGPFALPSGRPFTVAAMFQRHNHARFLAEEQDATAVRTAIAERLYDSASSSTDAAAPAPAPAPAADAFAGKVALLVQAFAAMVTHPAFDDDWDLHPSIVARGYSSGPSRPPSDWTPCPLRPVLGSASSPASAAAADPDTALPGLPQVLFPSFHSFPAAVFDRPEAVLVTPLARGNARSVRLAGAVAGLAGIFSQYGVRCRVALYDVDRNESDDALFADGGLVAVLFRKKPIAAAASAGAGAAEEGKMSKGKKKRAKKAPKPLLTTATGQQVFLHVLDVSRVAGTGEDDEEGAEEAEEEEDDEASKANITAAMLVTHVHTHAPDAFAAGVVSKVAAEAARLDTALEHLFFVRAGVPAILSEVRELLTPPHPAALTTGAVDLAFDVHPATAAHVEIPTLPADSSASSSSSSSCAAVAAPAPLASAVAQLSRAELKAGSPEHQAVQNLVAAGRMVGALLATLPFPWGDAPEATAAPASLLAQATQDALKATNASTRKAVEQCLTFLAALRELRGRTRNLLCYLRHFGSSALAVPDAPAALAEAMALLRFPFTVLPSGAIAPLLTSDPAPAPAPAPAPVAIDSTVVADLAKRVVAAETACQAAATKQIAALATGPAASAPHYFSVKTEEQIVRLLEGHAFPEPPPAPKAKRAGASAARRRGGGAASSAEPPPDPTVPNAEERLVVLYLTSPWDGSHTQLPRIVADGAAATAAAAATQPELEAALVEGAPPAVLVRAEVGADDDLLQNLQVSQLPTIAFVQAGTEIASLRLSGVEQLGEVGEHVRAHFAGEVPGMEEDDEDLLGDMEGDEEDVVLDDEEGEEGGELSPEEVSKLMAQLKLAEKAAAGKARGKK